jgi:hypothetical protein
MQVRAQSADYAALRDMRERMQMRDLDAKERASEKILAERQRIQELRRKYLDDFLSSDRASRDQIQAAKAKLRDMEFRMLKAEMLSGRNRQQWAGDSQNLGRLHQESVEDTKRLAGKVRDAFRSGITRFSTAGGQLFGPGQARKLAKERFGKWEGLGGRGTRLRSNYFLADGLALAIVNSFSRDDDLKEVFGANPGRAKDALRDFYLASLMAAPSEGMENNLDTPLSSGVADALGANTAGEVLNRSMKELQDDFGLSPTQVRQLLSEPAEALEADTQFTNYGSFLEYYGGDKKKARKVLSGLLGGSMSKEERETLEDAMEEHDFPTIFQSVANLPIIADSLGIPEMPNAEELEDLMDWLRKAIEGEGPGVPMASAPGRFKEGSRAYGEEMVRRLMANRTPDIGRGVAEEKLGIVKAIGDLQAEIEALESERAEGGMTSLEGLLE